jgi:hypothetical protein
MVDMSNGASRDAGGFVPAGPPPPGYPPPGYYPPPSYQGYPPPGYPPPGYPPPGYPPPGYPPPGYAPPWYPQGPPPALKPGVIPLRPLGLSDIFNGAIAYVRMNPKATLGLTTAVVVVAQLIALVMQIGPLAATGGLTSVSEGGDVSDTALIGSSLSSLASVATTGLATIVLSGLLTVVVGRAVFGAHITIGEAWQRARGRLLALIGFVVLEFFGAVILIVVVVGVLVATISAVNGGAAFVIGAPLVVALVVALVYLGVKLSFAPTLIVLERLDIVSAVRRSFALVKNDFWRVFGIIALGQLVSGIIAGAVSVPFSFGGQLLLVMGSGSMTGAIIGLILMAIGGAIGQIITSPFNAGVVVLLYTDRRMRAEAFDLVLQSGAATPPGTPADSTDHLWLTPHR